jgi:hypothetical protein
MSEIKHRLNVNLELIKPFGPTVMQIQMEPAYVDLINKYHDDVRADKMKDKDLDYSHALVGNVEKEIEVTSSTMSAPMPGDKLPSLAEYLCKLTEQYVHRINRMQTQTSVSSHHTNPSKIIEEHPIKLVTVLSGWTVAQFKGDYNPVHKHHGTVSCVAWTKVPECIEKAQERDEAGYFVLMDGFRSNLSANLFAVKPRVGVMLFFPSWLHHAVYPFRGEGERRSFSANFLVIPENEKDLLNLGVFLLDKKHIDEKAQELKQKKLEDTNAPKN